MGLEQAALGEIVPADNSVVAVYVRELDQLFDTMDPSPFYEKGLHCDADDNDYWINPDEVDDLACRPGATPHLIALLRRAVSGSPEGIDIVFARADQPRQSVRRKAGAV